MNRAAAVAAVALAATFASCTPAEAAANPAGGWRRDRIQVRYDTSPAWPVARVAEQLDNGSPLNLVPERPGAQLLGCDAGRQCILVWSDPEPYDDGVQLYRGGAHITDATVQLSDRWGRSHTAAQRERLLCRRLGRAVGLPTHNRPGSCLGSSGNQLDSRDLTDLNRMY